MNTLLYHPIVRRFCTITCLLAMGLFDHASQAAPPSEPDWRNVVHTSQSWRDFAPYLDVGVDAERCDGSVYAQYIAMHYKLAVNQGGDAYRHRACITSAEALDELTAWSAALPDSALARFYRADIAARSGRPKVALEQLETVLPDSGWFRPSVLNAIITLRAGIDPGSALRMGNEAISTNADFDCSFADTCYVLGMLELSVDARDARARRLFTATWNADSSHPLAYAGFIAADSTLDEVPNQDEAFFTALAKSPPSELLTYAASLIEDSDAVRGRLGSYSYQDYSRSSIGSLLAWGTSETSVSMNYNPTVGGASLAIKEGENLTRTREGALPITYTTY